MIRYFLLLTVYCGGCFISLEANASVIGPSECSVDVAVTSHDEDSVTGMTENAVNLASYDAVCQQYEGKVVRVRILDKASKSYAKDITGLKLGTFQGSSMGENGPVSFLHWEVLDVKGRDQVLPKENFSAIEVKVFDSVESNESQSEQK